MTMELFRAPFALRGAVLRFCVGASFVTVTFSIARGESLIGFLRGMFVQEKYPLNLLGAAFRTLRLLFDEALEEFAGGSEIVKLKNDVRLLPSEEIEFAAATKLLISSLGRQHLEQLETTFRAVRQEMYAARSEQTRILQDSHSLTMSQVALRGAEPSEDLLADQKLQMSILEGKYVRELEGLADAQRVEFKEFVMRFAAIERETPLSQRLRAASETEEKMDLSELSEGSVEVLTSVLLFLDEGEKVCKVSCVACPASVLGRSVTDLSGGVNALIVAADLLAGSKAEKAFCEAADELPELLFETCSQQFHKARTENPVLEEGNVLLTRHSNLPSCRLGLHVLSAVPSDVPSLAQTRAKTRVISVSLRRCLALCVELKCECVSIPLTFDAEERFMAQLDESSFAERVSTLISVAKEFLGKFRHIRFYIPAKIPQLTEMVVKLTRSIKTESM